MDHHLFIAYEISTSISLQTSMVLFYHLWMYPDEKNVFTPFTKIKEKARVRGRAVKVS